MTLMAGFAAREHRASLGWKPIARMPALPDAR